MPFTNVIKQYSDSNLDNEFMSKVYFRPQNVEISEISCQIDFTWNQFLGFQKFENCHFDIFDTVKFDVDDFFAIFEGYHLPMT